MAATIVTTLNELKAALLLPNWAETVQAQEVWLPHLAAALPWETRVSHHFVLHFYRDGGLPENPSFENFLEDSEQIYKELVQFFALAPQSKVEQLIEQGRLTYFIVATTSQRTFGGLTDPHLLFYLMDPLGDTQFMQRIRHELAHWVWSRRYGEAARLFQEGVAVYAELMSMPDASLDIFIEQTAVKINEAPPLTELVINEHFWYYADAYLIAGCWVAYLVEQWGWAPLKELFLRTDYEDSRILAHFQAVYGKPMEVVEKQWRQAYRA